MKVPDSTIWAQRPSYSSCEPSTQWMEAGLVSSAIFSTQRSRCLFSLKGTLTSRLDLRIAVDMTFHHYRAFPGGRRKRVESRNVAPGLRIRPGLHFPRPQNLAQHEPGLRVVTIEFQGALRFRFRPVEISGEKQRIAQIGVIRHVPRQHGEGLLQFGDRQGNLVDFDVFLAQHAVRVRRRGGLLERELQLRDGQVVTPHVLEIARLAEHLGAPMRHRMPELLD